MPKVTVYICPSYYNGDIMLGHDVEGDVDVEVVSLDIDADLPDLWELRTLEEADRALAAFQRVLDLIQSIEHPSPLADPDIEYLIDDLLYEIEQATLIRAAFERGEEHPYDIDRDVDPSVHYRFDPVAVAAESERSVDLDDLPANLRESFEEMREELEGWADLD
jgi:hypothetical protein